MADQNQQQNETKPTVKKVVLVHELIDPTGKVLKVGTELDANEPWVQRCVLPYDLWESKAVSEAKKVAAAEEAKAAKLAAEMIEKAKAEA